MTTEHVAQLGKSPKRRKSVLRNGIFAQAVRNQMARQAGARKRAEEKEREEREAEFAAKPLVERNAIKLTDLELEWSVLGPLRMITFSVCLGPDGDVARAFADDVETLGFKSQLSFDTDEKQWSLNATRAMEPTAANVTHWEEWFNARVEKCQYSSESEDLVSFEGWRYPKRVAPTFSLEGGRWRDASERERGRILFGQTLGYDPVSLKRQFDYYRSTPMAPPFRLVPSQFLSKARAQRPHNAEPTASKFAQWLYSLYADAYGSPHDRDEGKKAQDAILAARRGAYACVDADVLLASFPEWQLVHNGMQMAQSAIPDYFKIDDLKVFGEALRVLPDLIYRNQRTGEIIIVEIKHSRMAIPSNLWPNIWGQLWCYAQLEQVRESPSVTIIGEVWGDAWAYFKWRRSTSHLVCLRASVRRDSRAPAYDRFFRTLFDIYRGVE
ncbi:ribonuclease E inhibitor RraB [Acidisoma cellulosilytica]|uniref:Ribonuclease E inhibitor RraB n=1 Tax=Acidisoma cellulosilyticum TaxID=2802395 RepID=A0A963Z6H7_9PROT|nr:ribonuclease E inhibitor RraB [Acidisoma cellulosilyticum]MCB8883774.1 ribonuclease E inhibitor RraB [Acidisoma cellulosilyticum]